jgi:hypothetical protein
VIDKQTHPPSRLPTEKSDVGGDLRYGPHQNARRLESCTIQAQRVDGRQEREQ